MPNVFEFVILRLVEVGFYDLLLFVFSLTLFYAILKKFKILSESPVLNGVLAFVIAFLIFGYPVLIGYSLTVPMVKFFTQSMVFILLFFMAILMASFFYPDLPKFLSEAFNSKTYIWIGITLSLVALVISGLLGVMWETSPVPGSIQIPVDLSGTAAGLVILLAAILIASSVVVSK